VARRARRTREAVKVAILCFVLLFAFYPLFVMVVISFKDNRQFNLNPWFFDPPNEWHLENWARGWSTVSTYIANSVVVCVLAVALGMVMVVLTSYVLARYRFPGRGAVYYGVIASMFLPGTAATLVTMYALLDRMNLINSLWALVVVGAAGGQVAAIFILRQFIEDIPRELFEAAQIDGAGHFGQMHHVVLPMSGSILGTLAIMSFLRVWNNLMLPLVVLRDDAMLTVPVGLMRLEGEYVKQWGELMAGYTIAAIPLVILFIFTMRWFVRGIGAGAIKG